MAAGFFQNLLLTAKEGPAKIGALFKGEAKMTQSGVIDKEKFKKDVQENVMRLYRKSFKEATGEEVFQAVSLAVKDLSLIHI